MNSVKTYNKINKNDEKLNFSISKMEDIYMSYVALYIIYSIYLIYIHPLNNKIAY